MVPTNNAIMESMDETTLDPERQKRAKQYSRIKRRLMLLELLIVGLYTLVWLLFSWSKSQKAFLQIVHLALQLLQFLQVLFHLLIHLILHFLESLMLHFVF